MFVCTLFLFFERGNFCVQKKHEQALIDYQKGMKYKDIAEKYDVTLNTVKSWQQRHKWSREIILNEQKSVQTTTKRTQKTTPLKTTIDKSTKEKIRDDLILQLKNLGATQKHYFDLVDDYMKMWEVKNELINDIRIRGVSVPYQNGKNQMGHRRNDSVGDLIKTNAQMLKILAELGLRAADVLVEEDDPDEEL